MAGGWLGLAAAGSASQLASRTAAVAVADEVSRWPRSVRIRRRSSVDTVEGEAIRLGSRQVRLLAIIVPRA